MSHHIQMLQGLLPFERPQAPAKKRRLRKTSSGEVVYADEVDDISDADAVFTVEDNGTEAPVEKPLTPVAGRSLSGWFSGPAMKALLQAQEGK